MTQPRPLPLLPPKPIHKPPQRRLRLLRPRRQLLLALNISLSTPASHNTILLPSLRSSDTALLPWRSIHRHLHALRFRLPRRRKVLRRRITLVQRRGLRVLSLLCVLRVLLALRVIWVRLCVEGEVVLGDLAVALAFGVGDEELLFLVLAMRDR